MDEQSGESKEEELMGESEMEKLVLEWDWVIYFQKDSWSAFRFMCKHIIDNTRSISRCMKDRMVSNR